MRRDAGACVAPRWSYCKLIAIKSTHFSLSLSEMVNEGSATVDIMFGHGDSEMARLF